MSLSRFKRVVFVTIPAMVLEKGGVAVVTK
jgi:hypothetical protein